MFHIFNVSYDIGLTDRLVGALEGIASVIRVDPTIEAIRQMTVSVRPDLLVIDFAADSSEFAAAIGLVRAVQQTDSSWFILGVGDDRRAEVVLAAVRAGVRDFLDHAGSAETLRAQLILQLERAAQRSLRPSGKLTVVTSGQPNDGEGLFAVNYAVTQARQSGDTLLLDFHLPTTIAGPALDLGLNYTVRDAVHDLIRLDRTLLSTVLGRHKDSGLYVLPLALGAKEAVDVSSAGILSLLGALRAMFDNVVVNLAGLQNAELVSGLMQEADSFYLMASQRFTSVKACRDLVALLPAADARVTLLIDEHDPAIALSDVQMRTTLGLSRCVCLPRARAALVNAANRGVPFVTEQPRAPYAKVLAELVGLPQRTSPFAFLRRLPSLRLPGFLVARPGAAPAAGST